MPNLSSSPPNRRETGGLSKRPSLRRNVRQGSSRRRLQLPQQHRQHEEKTSDIANNYKTGEDFDDTDSEGDEISTNYKSKDQQSKGRKPGGAQITIVRRSSSRASLTKNKEDEGLTRETEEFDTNAEERRTSLQTLAQRLTLLSRIKRKTRFVKSQRAARIARFKARVERANIHNKLFGGAANLHGNASKRPQSVLGHYELVKASEQRFLDAMGKLENLSTEWSSASSRSRQRLSSASSSPRFALTRHTSRTSIHSAIATEIDLDELEADEALKILVEMLYEGRSQEFSPDQRVMLGTHSTSIVDRLVAQFSSMNRQTTLRGCGNWLARASRGLREENKVLEAQLALTSEYEQDFADTKGLVDAQILEAEYHEFNALNSFYAGLQQQARMLKQQQQHNKLQLLEEEEEKIRQEALNDKHLKNQRRGVELSDEQIRKHELEVQYSVLQSQFDEKVAQLELLQKRKSTGTRNPAALIEQLLENARQASTKKIEKFRGLVNANQQEVSDLKVVLKQNEHELNELLAGLRSSGNPDIERVCTREMQRLDDIMILNPEMTLPKKMVGVMKTKSAKVNSSELAETQQTVKGDTDGTQPEIPQVPETSGSVLEASHVNSSFNSTTSASVSSKPGRRRLRKHEQRRAWIQEKRDMTEFLQRLRLEKDQILKENEHLDKDRVELEKAISQHLRKSRREKQKEVEVEKLEEEIRNPLPRHGMNADNTLQLELLENEVDSLNKTLHQEEDEAAQLETSLAQLQSNLQEVLQELAASKQENVRREGKFDALVQEETGLWATTGEIGHQSTLMSQVLLLKTKLARKATERQNLEEKAEARRVELNNAVEKLQLLESELHFLDDEAALEDQKVLLDSSLTSSCEKQGKMDPTSNDPNLVPSHKYSPDSSSSQERDLPQQKQLQTSNGERDALQQNLNMHHPKGKAASGHPSEPDLTYTPYDVRILLSSIRAIHLDFRDLADTEITEDLIILRKDTLQRLRIIRLCDKIREARDKVQATFRERQQQILQRLQGHQKLAMEVEASIQASQNTLAKDRLALNELSKILDQAQERAISAARACEVQFTRIQQEYVGTVNPAMLSRAKELIRSEHDAQQSLDAARLKYTEHKLVVLRKERHHDLLKCSKLQEFSFEARGAILKTQLQVDVLLASFAASISSIFRELSPRTSVLRFLENLANEIIPWALELYALLRSLTGKARDLGARIPDMYSVVHAKTEEAVQTLDQAFKISQQKFARCKSDWVQLGKETSALVESYKQPDAHVLLQQRDAYDRAEKRFRHSQHEAGTLGLLQSSGLGQKTLPEVDKLRDTSDQLRNLLEDEIKEVANQVQRRIQPISDQIKPFLHGIHINFVQYQPDEEHQHSQLEALKLALHSAQQARSAWQALLQAHEAPLQNHLELDRIKSELSALETQLQVLEEKITSFSRQNDMSLLQVNNDTNTPPTDATDPGTLAEEANEIAGHEISLKENLTQLQDDRRQLMMVIKATRESKEAKEQAIQNLQVSELTFNEMQSPSSEGDTAHRFSVQECLLQAQSNLSLLHMGELFLQSAISVAQPILQILHEMPHDHFAGLLRTGELTTLYNQVLELDNKKLPSLQRSMQNIQDCLRQLDGLEPSDISSDNLQSIQIHQSILANMAREMRDIQEAATVAYLCLGRKRVFTAELELFNSLSTDSPKTNSIIEARYQVPQEVDVSAGVEPHTVENQVLLNMLRNAFSDQKDAGALDSGQARAPQKDLIKTQERRASPVANPSASTGLAIRLEELRSAREAVQFLREQDDDARKDLREAKMEENALTDTAKTHERALDEFDTDAKAILKDLTHIKEEKLKLALRVARLETQYFALEKERKVATQRNLTHTLTAESVYTENLSAFQEMSRAEQDVASLEKERDELDIRLQGLGMSTSGRRSSNQDLDCNPLIGPGGAADWQIVHRLQIELQQELGQTEAPTFGANTSNLLLNKLRKARRYHAKALKAVAVLRQELIAKQESFQVEDPGPLALAEANRLRIENRDLQNEYKELMRKATDSMALAQRAKVAQIEDERNKLLKEISRLELKLGIRRKPSKNDRRKSNSSANGIQPLSIQKANKSPVSASDANFDDFDNGNDINDSDEDEDESKDEEERDLERKLDLYEKQVQWWQGRWAEHMQNAVNLLQVSD